MQLRIRSLCPPRGLAWLQQPVWHRAQPPARHSPGEGIRWAHHAARTGLVSFPVKARRGMRSSRADGGIRSIPHPATSRGPCASSPGLSPPAKDTQLLAKHQLKQFATCLAEVTSLGVAALRRGAQLPSRRRGAAGRAWAGRGAEPRAAPDTKRFDSQKSNYCATDHRG